MAIRYPAWNLVPLMRLPREAVGWYFKDAKGSGRPVCQEFGDRIDPQVEEHIVEHQGGHQLVGVEIHL